MGVVIAFSIGILVGIFIGYNLKPYTPTNDDPTGELKKEIFDKLTSIKEDLENTV